MVDVTYAARAQMARETNGKVTISAEWAYHRAEGHPLVQELLVNPRIVLTGNSDA